MDLSAVMSKLPFGDGTVWIRQAWDMLEGVPRGRALYSRLLGVLIPYTGSIHAEVKQLTPGFSRVELPDRRNVRNHLSSIHAIALCNLAELTGNSALAYSLPPDARFIVSRLDIRYLKKARGTITGTCHCPAELTNERREIELRVQMRDPSGVLVAEATLTTLVGPVKGRR
jgi:acyl-coenzyme A thioesterase PaaI-like protein